MIKACIFDLDGTIADTVESIAVVGNRLLSHYGLKEQPVEGYNFFAGDGDRKSTRLNSSHVSESRMPSSA